jgi:flagellar motor switch protein FliG
MTDFEVPSGARKAAAFLLSLDRAAAAAVMKRLDPDVVAEVAEAMSRLDAKQVEPQAIDALYAEIARTLHAPQRPVRPNEKELAQLLESAYGAERSRQVLADLRERRKREHPFEFIQLHPPEQVAQALASESAAISALVLAHVAPDLSGAVLGSMEPRRALDVVRRMAKLVPPPFEVLESVAAGLEGRLGETTATASAPPPSERRRSIAEMLKNTAVEVEKTVLDGLETDDEAMVAEIREYMFSWNDLADLDKRGMQKVLASVDTQTLSLALKASPPGVEKNIMDNLSARVRDMVAEERELAGAVPLAEVEAARAQMLKGVRALVEAGELKTTRAGDELVS